MEPSNRDRDTEGDKENPKENLRSGARGGGGERALSSPGWGGGLSAVLLPHGHPTPLGVGGSTWSGGCGPASPPLPIPGAREGRRDKRRPEETGERRHREAGRVSLRVWSRTEETRTEENSPWNWKRGSGRGEQRESNTRGDGRAPDLWRPAGAAPAPG